MADCRGKRPEIRVWLEREIEAAIRRRTGAGGDEGFTENDPWDVEAEADRLRVFVEAGPRTQRAPIAVMLAAAAGSPAAVP